MVETSHDIAAHQAQQEALSQRIQCHPAWARVPRLVTDLANLGDHPEEAPQMLARLIGRDGALSGKLLQLCNCGPAGTGKSIGGVSQAIRLLGVEGVRSLALGLTLINELKRHEPAAFEKGLHWRRSIFAGAAASVLAEQLNCILRCEPLVAALLMDCGMIALDQVVGYDYQPVHAHAVSHARLSAAEQAVFGLDHGDVSGILARRWNLAAVLDTTMSSHHREDALGETVVDQVCAVVRLAARFADLFVESHPQKLAPELCRACASLGDCQEMDCIGLLNRIAERAAELSEVFGIPLDGSRTPAQVVSLGRERGRESRRSARFARLGSILIYPVSGGEALRGVKAQFHDLSSHGIGLAINFPLAEGERFVVNLPRRDGKPLPLTYRVVRCQRTPTGGFRVGADLQSTAEPAKSPRA